MLRVSLLVIILFVHELWGQPTYVVNNLSKYATGSNYLHRENLLDANVFYKNWTIYGQLELSGPPEFGSSYIGLTKVRGEYQSDNFGVKLGDVYPLWNWGLVLNLRYEKHLGYDSGLRGGELRFSPLPRFDIRGIFGRQKFHSSSPQDQDLRTHNWAEENSAQGLSLTLHRLQSPGLLSISGLHVKSEQPYHISKPAEHGRFALDTQFHKVNSYYLEGYWQQVISRWEAVINYAHKYSSIQDGWRPAGNGSVSNPLTETLGYAVYASLSGFYRSVGLTVEYKNYAYDLRPPAVWQDIYGNWPTRMSPFQRPPLGYREYSSTLLARQTHTVNYNDEIGFQLEVNYSGPWHSYLTGNISLGSRHHVYNILDEKYVVLDETTILPLMADGAFPFYQIHLEVEKYALQDRLYFKGFLNHLRRIDEFTQRTDISGESDITIQHRNANSRDIFTAFLEADYTFGGGNSISLYHENQWLKRHFVVSNIRVPQTSHDGDTSQSHLVQPSYNRLIIASFRYHKGLTLSLLYDFTNRTETGTASNVDPAEDNPLESILREIGVNPKNKWFGIELSLDFLTHHQISLFYGAEQGGIRCANGICREIPPFEDGLKLRVQSYF